MKRVQVIAVVVGVEPGGRVLRTLTRKIMGPWPCSEFSVDVWGKSVNWRG